MCKENLTETCVDIGTRRKHTAERRSVDVFRSVRVDCEGGRGGGRDENVMEETTHIVLRPELMYFFFLRLRYY